MVYNQAHKFVESNHLITSYQFGFSKPYAQHKTRHWRHIKGVQAKMQIDLNHLRRFQPSSY